MFHTLYIKDLSLYLKLGCLPEERKSPQQVLVNMEFRFPKAPHAIESDNLEDTICYAEVSNALKNYCEGKEFKLIEKLARDLALVTKDIIGNNIALSLTVHKVRPPIENLLGGTLYRISDFL